MRSTYFTLIAFFAGGLAFTIAASEGNKGNAGKASFDPVATSLRGTVDVGALVIVVIGTLVITSEYGTRMMGASLAAMPRRGVIYAAKAVVLTCVTLVVALITSFTSFFVGQAILASAPAGGASITSPGALRAVLLSAVVVTCFALLAFGLGALIRYTAGATTVLFGLVFLVPVLAQALPASWFHAIARWLPGGIALDPIDSAKPAGASYVFGPYGQLAIFAGYAAVAVVAGALMFGRRDA